MAEKRHVATRLTVNGKIFDLAVEPQETLAEVLRYRLGLTGTKISCDAGECGACTVISDGKAINACMTLAIEQNNRSITTIEGLAIGEKLHPIQQAWGEEHGFQCGYCASGFIMATKAFLDKNPNPDVEQIKQALAGNICRCGNYEHIVKAVQNAAKKLGEENKNGK
jgi:carbon-monoxide dehydrogenase small subunit